MALTVYCTSEHCKSIWSAFGVAVRADDRDGHNSTDRIDDAIEKATTDVNLYLFKRYTPAVIAASTWATWCTAMFACVNLARRRGNSVAKSLEDEYERYLQALKDIAAGVMPLPGDTGAAAPEFDETPLVTNFRVDSRYRANIRRVRQTSTQTQQSANRKGFDLTFYPYPYPFA